MNCPRCEKPVASGAAFCMNCGQMLAQPSSSTPGEASAITSATRTAGWMGVAVGLLLAAGVVLGLNSAGVIKLQLAQPAPGSLKFKGGVADSRVLASEGTVRDPDALFAQGESGGPTLPAGASLKVMPVEVRRWLEHLERIERRRIAMTEAQLASALTAFTTLQLGGSMAELDALLQGDLDAYEPGRTPPSLQRTGSDLDAMKAQWSKLTSDFNSLPPPDECVPIRNEYDQVVRETGAMIMDIRSALDRATTDRESALQALFSMRGKSAEKIGKPAEEAENLLREICEKYSTRKWFSIAKDVGSAGLLGGRIGL